MPRTFFARKPVNLQQLRSDDAELRRAFHSKGELYYIAEEKELSNQEWDKFARDLLVDTDWAYAFSNRHFAENENGLPCSRVTTPGSEIALIIDIQGYSYARYIGIESIDSKEESSQDDSDGNSSEIETEDEVECDQEAEGLTEEEVVDGLRALLMGESLDCTMLDSNTRTVTYEEGGYFTRDQGFAIHMANGQVFTITVKEGH